MTAYSTVGAHLSPKDLQRWVSALKRLERNVRTRARETARIQSLGYAHLLRSNVLGNRYAGTYAPYNPDYEEWKSNITRNMGFHVLKGNFLNAIRHWELRQTGTTFEWMGGIRAGVMDSGGKSWFGKGNRGPPKPIAMYARVFEFGGNFKSAKGGVHPARPVFIPTMGEYKSSGWRARGRGELRKLGNAWR